MAVEHQNSHTITTKYAKRCQSASKCICAQVKLFPGIVSLSTSNYLTGSCNLFGMCQSLCDVHAKPSLIMTLHTIIRSCVGADYANEQIAPGIRMVPSTVMLSAAKHLAANRDRPFAQGDSAGAEVSALGGCA